MGSFINNIVDKDENKEVKKVEFTLKSSLSDILEANDDKKISDVFNYFKNSV